MFRLTVQFREHAPPTLGNALRESFAEAGLPWSEIRQGGARDAAVTALMGNSQ